jgi:hypothetical protein
MSCIDTNTLFISIQISGKSISPFNGKREERAESLFLPVKSLFSSQGGHE